MSRAERVLPMKESENRLFPRPRAARSAADRAQSPAAPPKAGDAFRGGVEPSVPVARNLPGGKHSAPIQLSAKRVLPAPRAGGFPNFADFLGYTRSARHWNILRETLNSAVLHVGFPGYPPGTMIPPPPPGEVSAKPTEGATDPRG